MAGRVMIANAPWVFGLIWKIRPWLAPRTLDKVQIFTASDKEKQNEGFRRYVDPEVLPEAWGGQRPDSCLPVAGLLLSGGSGGGTAPS